MAGRTLFLIKPEVPRHAFPEILDLLMHQGGFRILGRHTRVPSAALLRRHYAEHTLKPHFPSLIKRLAGQPMEVMMLEDCMRSTHAVVQQVRMLVGDTDPRRAAAGTLRARWGFDRDANGFHASATVEDAQREILLWFPGMASGFEEASEDAAVAVTAGAAEWE